MKRLVIQLVCANTDMGNEQLALQLEEAITMAALDACGFVEIESVTVEDTAEEMGTDMVEEMQEESPISITAIIQRDGRGA